MNHILIKRWRRLQYHNPEDVLKLYHTLESGHLSYREDFQNQIAGQNMFRRFKEGRDAALFCYGISRTVLKQEVRIANHEEADYDAIARWRHGQNEVFTPIQLKEIVPQALNPASTLRAEIKKLRKYSGDDLVVAFRLNRETRFLLKTLDFSKLRIAELWVFGALDPEQKHWFLCGNLLGDPAVHEFDLPFV